MKTSVLLATLVATSLSVVSAQGPTTATIRGHVRSTKGAAIAGATVLIAGTRTGAIADSAGAYVISDIAPGTVTVRARFFGFADADQVVTIAAGDARVVDFSLRESIATLEAVHTNAKAAERDVFDERPNVGVTMISGRVASSVPRLGEADVLRAAQMLPGVEARNDFTAGLNVRGGEADQNQILLDGYPIFNPFHLGGLFGTFIDGAVGGLELRTGGFPASYGGRLSSVLDVKSTDEARPGTHGSATLSMLATSATVGRAFDGGKGSIVVSARRTYADQVLKALGLDAVPYYFRDGQLHATYRFTDRTSLAVTIYDGRDDLQGDLGAANSTADGGGFGFWWGNRIVGATLTHAVTDSLLYTQRLSYSMFNTALDLAGGALTLNDHVRQTTLHGSWEYKHGKHAPSFGYELEKNDMLYKAATGAAETPLIDEHQSPLSMSAFVDDVWRPSKRLLLEGGLRYERLNGSNWQAISPRLSSKFFVTPDFAITAAVGRYSQWLHSLAREDIPIRLFDFWTSSDAQIPVSRATHYVLGGESWFGPDRFVRIESYIKQYDRLLEPNSAEDPNVHGDEYLNLTGRSSGADVLLRQLERGRWGGWLAYTYTYSRRTGDAGSFYPGQDRRNNLNVLVSYRPSPKYVLSTRFGFASGTPYTDIVTDVVRRTYDINTGGWDTERRPQDVESIGGPRNASRLPPTQRLDFTLTRDYGQRVKITPFLSLINAYNAKNVFTYTFDYSQIPPQRSAFSQLPFLPTIGMSIEW